MLSDYKPKENYVVASFAGAILICGFLYGWWYTYFIVPKEGYRYTTAQVVRACGTGYIFRYVVLGKQIDTKCVPIYGEIDIGTVYLVSFAVADPEHFGIENYVLKGTLQAPDSGWAKAPLEKFKEIP